MSTQVEIVNPEDFGIDLKQQEIILGQLPNIISEREGLLEWSKKIELLDPSLENTQKEARECRLALQKVRTQGIEKWRKENKEVFLRGGQFVDAMARREKSINEYAENTLMEIEKHAERLEVIRKQNLRDERAEEIKPYYEFAPYNLDFGEMSEEEFHKVFNGAKLQYEAEQKRLEEERKEAERLDKIKKLHNERKELLIPIWQFVELKLDNFGEISEDDFEQIVVNAEAYKEDYEAEQERIRKENERLKREREEAEKLAKIEEEKRAKAEAKERDKQRKALEEERKKKAEIQAKLDAELKAREEIERKAREEAERKRLAEEAEKKAKLEAERLAKLEAERLAKLPIKQKMIDWIGSFNIADAPEQNEVSKDIENMFKSFKCWAIKQVDSF